MRKVIMQNLLAQSVNAPEKVGCFRNNTPNHTLTDLKARQSSKIREIGNALITAGIVSLDAQAKALGLPRSTAWTILSAEHKGTGISARIICRMLNSEPLPPLVRAKIVEYAKEKAAVEPRCNIADSPRSSNRTVRTNGLRRWQPNCEPCRETSALPLVF